MKNRLLIAAAAVSLLASCTKEYTQVVVNQPPYVPAFRVTGLNDVSFLKTPFSITPYQTLSLAVVYGNGTPQRVTLKVNGLPQGLKDSLSVKTGYPDFRSYLQLLYTGAANGTYRAELVATPDSGQAQTYTFNLLVDGDTSCSNYLTSGSYAGTSSCLGSGSYNVSLSKSAATGDTLLVSNFRNDGGTLHWYATCNSSSQAIPTQTINGIQYYGYGYVYSTYLRLILTERNLATGAYQSCTYTYTRN